MVMQRYLHELPDGVSPLPIDELRSRITNDFLSEIYKVLDVNLDWVIDPQSDRLLRHNMVQRSLSLQAALGFTDRNETRTLSSKLAWTLLSLRVVSLTFAFAYAKTSNTTGASETELSKPGKIDLLFPPASSERHKLLTNSTEVLQFMVGITAWSLTLTDYIIDQIFDLARQLGPNSSAAEIREKSNSTLFSSTSFLLPSSTSPSPPQPTS